MYANGKTPGVDVIHLHHAVWLNLSAPDPTSPGLPERFFAVGEEKTNMKLPPGYGYAYKTTDRWLLNYMLQWYAQHQFAKLDFDLHLPGARHTKVHFIGQIGAQ